MQNTDIFINPRQSVTFSNSIFHLEEKVTNYLFILHSQINKIASRADDVIKTFVELGGGIGDVLVWRCDGAVVMLGCCWRSDLTDVTLSWIVCPTDSRVHSSFGSCSVFRYDNDVLCSPPCCFEIRRIWMIYRFDLKITTLTVLVIILFRCR